MTTHPALSDITQGRDAERVEAAISELRDEFPGLADIVLERYASLAGNGPRKDAGAYLRSALVRGLRGIARPRDIPTIESMTYVYETMPRSAFDVAGNLRGAALMVLADLDARLALFHAARFLADPATSHMSGQPGVTAVQLLRANDQLLPLYVFLSGDGERTGELTGECLAALAAAPDSIVHGLIERFKEAQDDAALAGLYDLVLARAEDPVATAVIEDFVRTGQPDAVYAYVTKNVVAERRTELIELMLELKGAASGVRVRLLDEALALRR